MIEPDVFIVVIDHEANGQVQTFRGNLVENNLIEVTDPLGIYSVDSPRANQIREAIDIRRLIATIEQLRDERRWIPVSEELPEPNVPVEAWSAEWNMRYPIRAHVDAVGKWCGHYCGATHGDVDHLPPTDPTHWIPLPTTPYVRIANAIARSRDTKPLPAPPEGESK